MREEQVQIFGKEFTFARLPLGERTNLKFKLAALGLKDLRMDKDTAAVIGEVINRLGPDGSTKLLADIAKCSIVAPGKLSCDRKEKEFLANLDEFADSIEEDGIVVLWSLALESLAFQYGGIVEKLGKKSGINVQKIRDILKEKLT